jgi:alginate O-acetyltransferase complex protein AlgI
MDFSAYSDIAIGASRLFGIRIMENFDFPILAQNIANFWQRWHMTLGRWCQSYVYMPMIGLTRNPYIAVYCTWLAIGLWHAGSLNWVFWGLYHGTGVAIFVAWGRFKRRKKWFFLDKIVILRYMSIPVTFLFVSGSGSFTAIYGHGGVYDGFRILAKLIFINLPA